jgi:hypothetical protein
MTVQWLAAGYSKLYACVFEMVPEALILFALPGSIVGQWKVI